MRATASILALALVPALGCSAQMSPRPTPPGQLGFAYDRTLEIHADGSRLTDEPDFEGLEAHVECEPRARAHAREARRHGRRAKRLAWAGAGLGVASLGGLAGLAFLERDPSVAGAVIGSGLAVGVLGIVLAGSARAHRNRAAGNAVDAVNYWNDQLRREHSRCRARTQPRAFPDRRIHHPSAQRSGADAPVAAPPNPLSERAKAPASPDGGSVSAENPAPTDEPTPKRTYAPFDFPVAPGGDAR